jgi:hypothetical protein
MLKKGAIIVARWALEDSIPLVYLTDPTQLQHMQKGITFHYVVSYAFHESTHTDPGQNFPKRTFMRMVKKQVKRIRAGK